MPNALGGVDVLTFGWGKKFDLGTLAIYSGTASQTTNHKHEKWKFVRWKVTCIPISKEQTHKLFSHELLGIWCIQFDIFYLIIKDNDVSNIAKLKLPKELFYRTIFGSWKEIWGDFPKICNYRFFEQKNIEKENAMW